MQLPRDVVLSHILTRLDTRSLLRVARCCKALQCLAYDARIWSPLFTKELPEFVHVVSDHSYGGYRTVRGLPIAHFISAKSGLPAGKIVQPVEPHPIWNQNYFPFFVSEPAGEESFICLRVEPMRDACEQFRDYSNHSAQDSFWFMAGIVTQFGRTENSRLYFKPHQIPSDLHKEPFIKDEDFMRIYHPIDHCSTEV